MRHIYYFACFSSQLDEDTRHTLARGRRIREILTQPQHQTLAVPAQIASLLAVTSGAFDDLPPQQIATAERQVQRTMTKELPDICQRIASGDDLSSDDVQRICEVSQRSAAQVVPMTEAAEQGSTATV